MSQPSQSPHGQWRLVWTLEQMTEVIRAVARSSSTESVHVEDAGVEWRFDLDDSPVLLVTLYLDDPPKGQETWPVDDLYQIRQAVRHGATEAEIAAPLTFLLKSKDESDSSVEESDRTLADHLNEPEQGQ